MTIPTNQQAYAKVRAFVQAIDLRDSQALLHDFGVSSAVADEIYESIDDYFDTDTRLSIAAENAAFKSRGSQRPFMDVYETNDKSMGVECVLFANGAPSEAILHAEIFEIDDQISVYYKYIGS